MLAYYESKYSEKEFKTALTSIGGRLFLANNPEKLFNLSNSNTVGCLKRCAPLETVYIRNDDSKVNLNDDIFKSKLFNLKTTERPKWNIVNDTRTSKKSKQNHTSKKFFWQSNNKQLQKAKFFES